MTQNQKYQYKNEKQYQQQEQNQQSSSTSTTSSIIIPTEPGVSIDPYIKMQIAGLRPAYTEIFGGRGIPAPIEAYFARLIRAGMEPAVIASAINATAWARVPTPYYMRAILQRYMSEGIMTEAKLNYDMMEMDGKRHNQRAALEDMMYPEL